MWVVATTGTPSSSSAAGSRTQAACRIELRFIALGALESKGGVATPGPSIRPASFFGKRLPLTGCGVQHALSIVVEKLPRTDALSKTLLNALYWTVMNPFICDSTALRLAQQRPISFVIAWFAPL